MPFITRSMPSRRRIVTVTDWFSNVSGETPRAVETTSRAISKGWLIRS